MPKAKKPVPRPKAKATAKAAKPKSSARRVPKIEAAPPDRRGFMWKLLERKEAELKRRQENNREGYNAVPAYVRRRGA